MDWKAEAIRCTLFLRVPVSNKEVEGWWESIFSSKPDLDNVNNVTGERKQEGNILGGRLVLNVRPERIDWNLLPIVSSYPPVLGEVVDLHDEFKKMFSTWLDSEISVKRIAIGSIYNNELEDHEKAYQFLDGKLPHLNLSTSSFDFNYQINRPRFISTSFDENFKVNRLSKWNAIKGIFELNKPGEGKVVEHKFYAARCELDISTDADFMDELPKEDLKAFLEYAIGFSQEILDNGDCE